MGKYGDAMDAEDGDAAIQRDIVTQEARKYSPDDYVKAIDLARQSGVPASVIARDPEKYVRRSKYATAMDAEDAPTTNSWLSDFDNAVIAQDDHDSLFSMEKLLRQAKVPVNLYRSMTAGTVKAAGSAISGTGQLIETGGRYLDRGAQAVGLDWFKGEEDLPWWTPSQLLKTAGGAVEKFSEEVDAPEEERNLATDIAGGLGQIATQIATAILTGGTGSAISLVGQGADIQADRADAAGATVEEKDQAVLLGSAITAATERWGLNKLLNRLPPKVKGNVMRWFADVFTAGGQEALQEVTEGVLQNVVEATIYNPDAPIFEGLERDAAAAGGSGAIARAIISTLTPGRQKQRAERDRSTAENLSLIAQASKTAQRSPEKLEELVAKIKEETGADTAYIDPEGFRTLFQSDKEAADFAEQLTGSKQTLFEAAVSGTKIAVPIEKYVARIATRTDSNKLFDFVTFDADGVSAAEAKEQTKGDKLEKRAGDIAKGVIDDMRAETSGAIYDDALAQLVAAGRDTRLAEREAALTQAVFRTVGIRAGMDPLQLYQKYGLKIQRGTLSGGTVLQQSSPQIDSPEFKAWFRDSKVVDAGGLPMVAFHQTPNDFSAFKPGGDDSSKSGRGIWFSPSKKFLPSAHNTGGRMVGGEVVGQKTGTNVMPVFLNIRNPLVIDETTMEWAQAAFDGGLDFPYLLNDRALSSIKKEGYDGIILMSAGRFDGDASKAEEIIAFEPTQIKSAIGNRGTFDPSSPNILFQPADGGGRVDKLQMVAERGQRVTGEQAEFTKEEKAAIAESAEKIGISAKEITRAVREHKLAHPPEQGWAPLVYKRSVIRKKKVVHEYEAIPYRFNAGDDGRSLKDGSKEYKNRVNALARAMRDEVRRVYRRAVDGDKNAENIVEQATWYQSMQSSLRREFGGLGDLFADLLGAASPNTPVRGNWDNAIDALRRASRGDFDELMPQWEAWADQVDDAEIDLRAFVNAGLEAGKSRKEIKSTTVYKSKIRALKTLRKLPDDMLPTKESGKKYGFNGRNIVRAMVDLWRVVKNQDADIGRGKTAPKAVNFSGNLIGIREGATIDVWAARMLQRLSGNLRIPSMAEMAVTGAMRESGKTTLQFGFGQDVFTAAVKRIREDDELKTDERLQKIGDDDLQALVWFIEKELWTVNDWTNAAGEGGSFELEAKLTGSSQQARIKELRKIADSKKSSAEQKAAARKELATLERSVDRFIGGLSIEQSASVQGEAYVPTDSDMARLGNAIRTVIYESNENCVVLGSKAVATEGRYGSAERSLDLEVVAREGFKPEALWREMVTQAKAANQDSVFLSRVLRADEDVDYTRHRPGVEIYFSDSKGREQLDKMLAALGTEGVEYLTVAVDGRRLTESTQGAMPAAVGVRMQFMPEFDSDGLTGLDGEALAAKIEAKGDQLSKLADRVAREVEGVSFAGQFWYETRVAFSSGYEEELNADAAGSAQENAGDARSRGWTGQSIQEGLASADRQSRAKAERAQSGTDVLGGDAQRAAEEELSTLFQTTGAERGAIQFGPDGKFTISLLEKADPSTFIHESGHLYLELLGDIAEDAQAPKQIKDDYAAALKWLGVKSRADIKEVHHEKWARGFEAYLMEGKSPSIAMQSAFSRFKMWLIGVYRTLARLNVQLTDEVRGIMDRLVATDDEIAAAEEAQGYAPIFTTAEEAGYRSEREWEAYKGVVAKAHQESVDNLAERAMRELTREKKAWWKAERQKMIEEITPEVNERAVYRALAFLADGKNPDGTDLPDGVKPAKLDRKAVGAFARILPKTVATKDGTMSPTIAAQLFGYSSADQFLTEISRALPKEQLIGMMADERMRTKYGDMMNDGSLAEQAMDSVHTESRAKVMAAELKALSSKRKEVKPFVKAARDADAKADREAREANEASLPDRDEIKAIKLAAQRIIASKKVRDIRPSLFRQAEAKAGRLAFEAAAKGKYEEAYVEKRRQILNHELYRAATRARGDVDAIVEFMRSFNTKSAKERLARAGGEYLDQIEALLERFDFGRVTSKTAEKRTALAEWVAEQEAKGRETNVPEHLLNEARRTPYKELLFAELEGLHDAVRNIDHLARTKDRMLKNRKEADWQTAHAELLERAQQSLPEGKAPPISRFDQRRLERIGEFAKGFSDSLLRPETIIEWLDGGTQGPWHDYFWNLANDADEARDAMRDKIAKPLMEAARNITRKRRAELHEPVTIASMPDASVHDRRTLISIALNMGNASNMDKLMRGGYRTRDGSQEFTQANIDEIKAALTKEDWDFIQTVWDTVDQMWPMIVEFQKKMGGLVPERVQAVPVETPYGTYRGGYFPVVYDPESSPQGERQVAADSVDEIMGRNFTRASTKKGHTQTRTKVARPLLLDYERVVTRHMDHVITDLTHREFVLQAMRILDDKQLRAQIQNRIGSVAYRSLQGMVRHTVRADQYYGDPAANSWSKVQDYLIRNTAVAALGFRAVTAWGNLVLAPIQAAARVKPAYILRGIGRFYYAPRDSKEFIHQQSLFMKHRAENLDATFVESLARLRGERGIRAQIARAAMAVHRWADFLATNAIWLGKYQQTIDEGGDTETARREADKAIRQTQTSAAPKDLSAFERDPTWKAFKLFLGPMVIMGNRIRESAQRRGVVKNWVEAFGTMTAVWFLPALLWEIAAGRAPDEEDDKLLWALRKEFFYPFLTVPFIRDIATLAERTMTGQYTKSRSVPVLEAGELVVKAGIEAGKAGYALYEGDDVETDQLYRDALRASGPLLGLPSGQLDVTSQYLFDVASGEYDPEGVGDLKYLAVRREE